MRKDPKSEQLLSPFMSSVSVWNQISDHETTSHTPVLFYFLTSNLLIYLVRNLKNPFRPKTLKLDALIINKRKYVLFNYFFLKRLNTF